MTSRAGADVVLDEDTAQVLVGSAGLAPSLHNTQPWSFAVEGGTVRLYADRGRQLPEADPEGRSLLVGCGAALFNLRVAAAHLGLTARVELLPDPDDETLVATVRLERSPDGADPLAPYFEAIARRRTNRWPFQPRQVPVPVQVALAEAALAENAVLRFYVDPISVARIVDLLALAQAEEHGGVLEERARWVGPSRTGADSGIPTESLGPRPRELTPAFRDLGTRDLRSRPHASFEQTPLIGVLSTFHDARTDWVRAGQALERVLLHATTEGLSASFMNAPLERADLRWLVRSPLDGVGYSHMLLRIGYGEAVPATPRRAVAEILHRVDGPGEAD